MYATIAICEVCRHYVPPGHLRPESDSEEECPAPECPLNQARIEAARRACGTPASAEPQHVS